MGARADVGGAGDLQVTGPADTTEPGHGSARPGGAEVQIDGIGKTFRRGGRRTVALAGVNLEVRAGELVCLLGPSGCGKSTLLRIVAGALAQDEGTVTVGGQPVNGPSQDRGMLFQSPMLFPWLTTKKKRAASCAAGRPAPADRRGRPPDPSVGV